MKVVENSPQNARNCTNNKNKIFGHMPPNPLTTVRSFAARNMTVRDMYTENPLKFYSCPPPLRNPAYALATVLVRGTTVLHSINKVISAMN